MFAENRKISLRQLQALLILDCFGTGVLFLPAELAQSGGKACWVIALLWGLLFTLLSYLLAYVGKSMEKGTVVEWVRQYFGMIGGTLFLMGLAVNLWLQGFLELRLFSEIVCRSMLPSTPVWVVSLVILGVAGALAAQGTECRGRTAEALFFLAAIPLAVILISVAISSEYRRILPLTVPSFEGVGAGFLAVSIVFQGLLFLYFIFPDLQKTQSVHHAVLRSSFVTTVVATIIIFLCLAVYGASVLSEKLLPALQMMERVSFTGIFLTRQDVLLLWFWMVSVCIFLSGTLFYGSLLGVKAFRQQESKRKIWLWVCLAVVFAASFLPENLSEAYHWRLRILPWFHLVYLLIVPLLLLFLVRRGGKTDV